jgi:hypothetical protein
MIKPIIVAIIGIVALASCSAGGTAYDFYVVMKPQETERLIAAVTEIAKDNGLETAVSRVVESPGNVLWIVNGWGHGQTLRVQNTPQSGKEDPKLCGVHSRPHSDPGQFTVLMQPGFLGSRTDAAALGERVFSTLQKSGFDVRRKPVICGAAG